MNFRICHQTYVTVLDLLKKMSLQFTPSLEDILDLTSYAKKLADNATFLICRNGNQIIGSIIFYQNNTTSVLYIPLVWVDEQFRGFGVAKRMFEILIKFGKDKGLSYIHLEVLKINISANNLYKSLGFSKLEDRLEKTLMGRPI